LGIKQLEVATRQGDYLRPFAKILLALAGLREKQADLARTELKELVDEFPENPLFARELAMRRSSSLPASSPHSWSSSQDYLKLNSTRPTSQREGPVLREGRGRWVQLVSVMTP